MYSNPARFEVSVLRRLSGLFWNNAHWYVRMNARMYASISMNACMYAYMYRCKFFFGKAPVWVAVRCSVMQ